MIKGWFNPSNTPEQLMLRYSQTKEQKYLIKLIELFNLPIYHYLLSLSNKETAEDALQTTWIKVMQKSHYYKNQQQVKSWLFAIARNTLIDELRHQQKWQWTTLNEETLISPSNHNDIEQKDRLTLFNNAVESLPFFQREAFIFQQEGFSISQICAITDQSFETIKSRLRYARKNLKAQLGNHHD